MIRLYVVDRPGNGWNMFQREDGRWQVSSADSPTYTSALTDDELLTFLRTGIHS
jgi:hypothetical protein